MTSRPRPTTPVVTIFVDGRPAVTTGLAARRYGMKRPTTQKAIDSVGVDACAYLEGRPLYDVEWLDTSMAARPRAPKRPVA